MIGAVQLVAINYTQAELPRELANAINLLRSNPAVRLLDVYAASRARDRTISERSLAGVIDGSGEVLGGEIIRNVLRSARARRVRYSYTTDLSGFLVRGGPVIDLYDSLPPGTNAVLLLIEHRWSQPLEDAMRNTSASPLADGWVGREELHEAGYTMNDVPA
ncbi:hypothetical protein [Micromonospora sp. NPDC023956]|uniref:hypothetical protein n=1 Tax=Micromonospora sp. NPDC023956 TaxID=3155722 RepID=UPI0033EB8EA0